MDADERLLDLWVANASKQARARRKRELRRDRRRKDKMPRRRIWGMTMRKEKPEESKETNKMRVGAWNVRKLGSKGEWQYWKWRCMREWWTKRKWKAALLSEVHGKGKKVEETGWGDKRWTVIYNDKAAVALNAEWAARWRKGGSKIQKSSDGRSIAVDLPPK